jgi:CDGSH-type Zn-finger protein
MATDPADNQKKIIVEDSGPYIVKGGIPLVQKTQVVSEYGEPLTWKKGETLETRNFYRLCRCGLSEDKPFCDDAHVLALFEGTEAADTRPTAERQTTLPGSTHLVVKRDQYLCTDSGFCGTRDATLDELVARTDDTNVRSQVIAMVERCPAGALVYAIEEGEPDIEPDLPQQIAVTTEITSAGPVEGPLWVTGNIPVERADGQPFETRNRVALCNCGESKNKPLCDGAHRKAH